jgi:PqqD family protein of HPr-rel-A system
LTEATAPVNRPSAVWHRSPQLRLEPLGDALVAYQRRRGDTEVLTPLAAALFESLASPASEAELARRLELDAGPANELSACLATLERHDLVYRDLVYRSSR